MVNGLTHHHATKDLPRECPTVVMVFAPNLFTVVFTAARTSFAALERNQEALPRSRGDRTYSAWAILNPAWTFTSELKPGKREESRLTWMALASVRRGILGVRKKPTADCEMANERQLTSSYIFFPSVP